MEVKEKRVKKSRKSEQHLIKTQEIFALISEMSGAETRPAVHMRVVKVCTCVNVMTLSGGTCKQSNV